MNGTRSWRRFLWKISLIANFSKNRILEERQAHNAFDNTLILRLMDYGRQFEWIYDYNLRKEKILCTFSIEYKNKKNPELQINAVVVKHIYKIMTSQSPQGIDLGILILFKLLSN